MPLERICGRGVVFDLSAKKPNEPITAADLEKRAGGLRDGDIAVLRTDWTDRAWGTPAFWTDSPYLTRDAADWLVGRRVSAVVYDFVEEYAVRTPGFTGADCEVHHAILGAGIYNIEYVIGLGRIPGATTTIIALPLRLVGVESAPARVIALED
ncbi:MAG: cyclase family protein [Candidatus Rokubacteria bacterium]|nr:cyclase family protein [Candidatus Rokubacteria bacterium]